MLSNTVSLKYNWTCFKGFTKHGLYFPADHIEEDLMFNVQELWELIFQFVHVAHGDPIPIYAKVFSLFYSYSHSFRDLQWKTKYSITLLNCLRLMPFSHQQKIVLLYKIFKDNLKIQHLIGNLLTKIQNCCVPRTVCSSTVDESILIFL